MKRTLFACFVAVLLVFSIGVSPASAAKKVKVGKPLSTIVGGGVKPGPGARTIPYFGDTFTFSGKTYGYTMVGTAPGTGATTTVPTEIQPIKVVFADGTIFDASSIVGATVASPIFQPASFISGFTQYGDAIQRAEFWNVGGSGSYHVLLGQPRILPTLTLNVPSGAGFTATASRTGATIGVINISWWGARITEALNKGGFSPTTLPIFLSKDILLYISKPGNCCVFGFHGSNGAGHGNGNEPIQTYAWSSWISTPIFSASSIVNVNGLSHEISEWYNDPFVINKTPTWFSPLAPQYGCSSYLEDGDPLVGVSFNVNGYSLQDEAFKSWFAHDVPSTGINGQYTYLGTFNSPSPLC
ncbi:MAG: hypothetical protein M3P01_04225 [Actinomycetota bacterium]|nr:hypothetical protein [Actinomycetota bacterium]